MLKDLNYFPLDVESNIYGMTTLEFDDKTNKVLVATLDCRIYCINYHLFKPQTREVEFTYIPNGAKIISIGALKRGPDDFVIGITHSLAPNAGAKTSANREFAIDSINIRQTTYYFNIYASESVLPSFDLDYVAQGCQTLRLRYVPYHLYSTEHILASRQMMSEGSDEEIKITRRPFWLLSGGDNSLHAFFEGKPHQSFNEVPIEDYLPELSGKQGLALWIDIINLERSDLTSILFERAIALGFEDGSVRLYHSVLTKQTCKFELIRLSSFDCYSTIIPCVRLFKINSKYGHPSRLRDVLKKGSLICDKQDQNENHLDVLNLLVVSSTNPCLLFEDILERGLQVKHELPDSQRLDCVTTATIGDANADGFNELLIGTYGRELLTYQFNPVEHKYELEHINVSNHPIFALSVLDLTGDASKDVVILLTNGILVMQSLTIKDLIKICRRRLGALLDALKNS